MATSAEKKLYPIQHYVKIMLLISFAALVLDVVISYASISIVKQQSVSYLQNSANLYINQINHDFSYINHYMGWTLVNDENVTTMDDRQSGYTKALKAKNNLYKSFSELQKNYGQEYNFFLYLRNSDFFVNIAPMNLTYPEYKAFEGKITADPQNGERYEPFYSKWTTIELNGSYFIINVVPYHDKSIICLISADDLIRPLREINLGENGYVSLMSEDGASVTSPVSNSGKALKPDAKAPSLGSFFQTGTSVNREFTDASFFVRMVIRFGAFEKIIIAQLLIILVAVIIACNLSFIMLYFKKKVLKPVKSFSYNLTRWTEEGGPLHVESSRIVELEKANSQFLHLIDQIKRFKIDLYERELEKQRIQLDYMKLQIKPHFFLNCLTSIYSMAQMQMDEDIQHMAMSTSKYFRYIVRNGQDFVRLEDEIEHVRVYLEIQKHRYRDAFAYSIEQGEEAAGTSIPPLVLQTFIENAIKYAVSREDKVHISIAVSRQARDGGPVTVIRIADTGPGFPRLVLERLEDGGPLDQTDGARIGIANTRQRLEYLYGGRAGIRFFNGKDGGACVTLYLPEGAADAAADPERGGEIAV